MWRLEQTITPLLQALWYGHPAEELEVITHQMQLRCMGEHRQIFITKLRAPQQLSGPSYAAMTQLLELKLLSGQLRDVRLQK